MVHCWMACNGVLLDGAHRWYEVHPSKEEAAKNVKENGSSE